MPGCGTTGGWVVSTFGERMRVTACACLFVNGLWAQVTSIRPEFEAAVIKPYKAGAADEAGHVMPGGQLAHGNVTQFELAAWHIRSGSTRSREVPPGSDRNISMSSPGPGLARRCPRCG